MHAYLHWAIRFHEGTHRFCIDNITPFAYTQPYTLCMYVETFMTEHWK